MGVPEHKGPETRFYQLQFSTCPACNGLIIELGWGVHRAKENLPGVDLRMLGWKFVHPAVDSRIIPKLTPKRIAEEFRQACKQERLSPVASVTLARRVLEAILKEQGYRGSRLEQRIDAAKPHLPTHLVDGMTEIRQVGNLGAHPPDDVSVDPDHKTARRLLDLLEQILIHFYYDQIGHAENQRKIARSRANRPPAPPPP